MKRTLWFLPALVLLALVVVYPILRTAALSFFHDNLGTEFRPQFAGFENYTRLIFDSRFRDSLRVTLLFTVVSVGLEFLIGLALAIAVQQWNRGRGAIRTIFLIPWTLPTAIIALLWVWIFNDQYGIVNALLSGLGVIRTPIAWLATPATAMAAIIAADVWKTVPFVFLILLAGLQNISIELYEAIEVDGGGPWAKFRYVTWPMLLPFVFVALMFRIIQAFAIFDLVYVMTGGGPGGSTETVSLYSYQTYMRYLDFGYGTTLVLASVCLLGVAAIVLYAILLRSYEGAA
jgi:multiple sugar transport system permease protein